MTTMPVLAITPGAGARVHADGRVYLTIECDSGRYANIRLVRPRSGGAP